MKIRTGFVTNSSSSSFILHYNTEEKADKVCDDLLGNESLDIWDLEVFSNFESLVSHVAEVEGMSYGDTVDYLEEYFGVVEDFIDGGYILYVEVELGDTCVYLHDEYTDNLLGFAVD